MNSHSVIFYPNTSKTFIYSLHQTQDESFFELNRLTSSELVVVHEDASFIVIYFLKLQTREDLSMSSNNTITSLNQPLTIIYPSSAESLIRVSLQQTQVLTSAKVNKKRTKDTQFSPAIQSTPKSKAFIMLF